MLPRNKSRMHQLAAKWLAEHEAFLTEKLGPSTSSDQRLRPIDRTSHHSNSGLQSHLPRKSESSDSLS